MCNFYPFRRKNILTKNSIISLIGMIVNQIYLQSLKMKRYFCSSKQNNDYKRTYQ